MQHRGASAWDGHVQLQAVDCTASYMRWLKYRSLCTAWTGQFNVATRPACEQRGSKCTWLSGSGIHFTGVEREGGGLLQTVLICLMT